MGIIRNLSTVIPIQKPLSYASINVFQKCLNLSHSTVKQQQKQKQKKVCLCQNHCNYENLTLKKHVHPCNYNL